MSSERRAYPFSHLSRSVTVIGPGHFDSSTALSIVDRVSDACRVFCLSAKLTGFDNALGRGMSQGSTLRFAVEDEQVRGGLLRTLRPRIVKITFGELFWPRGKVVLISPDEARRCMNNGWALKSNCDELIGLLRSRRPKRKNA
ncbi:MAG: hypothetical protein PVI21_03240 [Candidatus Woesebacteria bacterium]|jgi:hypothetical protein